MHIFLKKFPGLLLFSITFLVVSLSLIITTGYFGCSTQGCGLHLVEWHMHDSLWHISLAKLGFIKFPFENPLFAGGLLGGYNFGIDLLLALFIKLGLDPFLVFFKILPICAGLFYVYAVLSYLKASPQSKTLLYLQAFFLFFGNSYSYLAPLFSTGSIIGATFRGFPVVTSLQPTTMFLNLQFSISLSLLLLLLTRLRLPTTKKLDRIYFLVMFFLLFGLKFYAGIIGLLLTLFLLSPKKYYSLYLASGIGSYLAYLAFYQNASNNFPFQFAPFAISHLLIDDPLLFFNQNLTLARYYLYENLAGFPARLILIEVYSLFLFAIINFGPRLIGFFTLRSYSIPKDIKIYTLVALLSFLIPVLFVQEGGWYNTMQFLYYGVFLAGISTAYYLNDILHHRTYFNVIVSLVIISMLPNTLEQLRYPFLAQNLTPQSELNCLKKLKDSPPGVVHVNRPWAKRAIIPALAEKQMFYLDTDQLDLTQIDYSSRLSLIRSNEGGSIRNVPADYYYIYKNEVGSPDSLKLSMMPITYLFYVKTLT